MSNHTPGPWVANGRYIGVKNHMTLIGECKDENGIWSNDPTPCANARLIAAAPDLLEAMEEIVRLPGDYNLLLDVEFRFQKARAAIAKARGKK